MLLNCGVCRYWKPPHVPPGMLNLAEIAELRGNCHLHPPTAALVPAPPRPGGAPGMGLQVLSFFPPTHRDEGCGDGKELRDTDDA